MSEIVKTNPLEQLGKIAYDISSGEVFKKIDDAKREIMEFKDLKNVLVELNNNLKEANSLLRETNRMLKKL